jgi:hypothetical protein
VKKKFYVTLVFSTDYDLSLNEVMYLLKEQWEQTTAFAERDLISDIVVTKNARS